MMKRIAAVVFYAEVAWWSLVVWTVGAVLVCLDRWRQQPGAG
jgi:hypothetical protein